MRVTTNVQSMVAQRRLRQVNDRQQRENIRLSSGDRIYQASYDPAGLAITEGMKAKIRSQSQAIRNANDGVSLLQVAEGTLSVMQNTASRLKELALQAANDTIGDGERALANQEFQALKKEMYRMSQSARFNGKHILNDRGSVYDLQIGVNASPNYNQLSYNMNKVLNAPDNFGIGSADISSKFGAQNALSKIDKVTTVVSGGRAEIGALENRLQSVMRNLETAHLNTSASKSQIRDADVALEASNRAVSQIKEKATLHSLNQSNNQANVILKLVE